MRRVVFLSLFTALALSLAGPQTSAAPPALEGAGPLINPAPPHFSDAQKADLKRISDYLNTLKSIQGRFLQVGGDGKQEQGNFYLKKPGRVRFEYQKPNPNLVIADGATVAVQNADLHTTDRYPLRNSPLQLLLSDNIDLASDRRISAVKHEPGALSMTARDTMGRITLSFADSGTGLELRQWDVVDAQGSHTTIVVNEMRQAADIPARLFVIEDLSPFKRNGR
ncbi:MAG TPA: outer-membrane lipoprotein carrier protein LolA [Micropepsaceae bacterium]|nr:outer-membrane lipoprotein carrier protein LolA [Micropepsaceae bacterium]